jgi:hypothetical protein
VQYWQLGPDVWTALKWPRRSLSMRGYLVLIVISILVPVLLFAAVLFSHYYYSELARIEEELKNNARELALAIDRDLQGQQFTLQSLAIARLITNRDFPHWL